MTHPGGRPRLTSDKKRRPRDLWMTDGEWAFVTAAAEQAGLPTRTYSRRVLLRRHIRSIPEINREAWTELSRLAGNLNQIAHFLNAGGALADATVAIAVADLTGQVAALRMDLLSASHDTDEDDDRQD